MYETKSIQSKGNSYICGLRIEKIEKTKEKTSEEIFKDWFS